MYPQLIKFLFKKSLILYIKKNQEILIQIEQINKFLKQKKGKLSKNYLYRQQFCLSFVRRRSLIQLKENQDKETLQQGQSQIKLFQKRFYNFLIDLNMQIVGQGVGSILGDGEFEANFLMEIVKMRQQILIKKCGRPSSHVITNERQVMSCGTNASMSFQNKFEITKLNISLSMMIPVRIISTWSKMLEITYITFANCTSCVDLNINKKLKIINSLIQLWSESPDPTSVDPPFNNAISNYIYEASMKKPFPDLRQQVKSYYKYHKEQMYIDDDRLWAMKKGDLIHQINEYQKSIPKDHKLKNHQVKIYRSIKCSRFNRGRAEIHRLNRQQHKIKNMLERIAL